MWVYIRPLLMDILRNSNIYLINLIKQREKKCLIKYKLYSCPNYDYWKFLPFVIQTIWKVYFIKPNKNLNHKSLIFRNAFNNKWKYDRKLKVFNNLYPNYKHLLNHWMLHFLCLIIFFTLQCCLLINTCAKT